MASQADEILLNNNQSTYSNLLTFHTKTFKGVEIGYTVIRGDLVEMGNIYLSYNRFANTVQSVIDANFDETGVLFCASVDADYVRLLYTSTNTGIQPVFKYDIIYYPL